MSPGEALLLLAAGIGGGLCGSVAGLASLFTYPALLAFGLAPVTANVTNSVALVFSSAGSISGSRPELLGQARWTTRLAIAGVIGGAVGSGLLLLTPSGSFELAVPWLIALASIAMLVRRRLVDEAAVAREHHAGRGLFAATAVVSVYGGYFGAGAGVMLLAVLLFATDQPLPSCNGVKNVVLGVANGVAAVAFAVFGPVRWAVVLPLGIGLFIGGRLGPIIVRRVPTGPLRALIAIGGLGLAVKLAIKAYV